MSTIPDHAKGYRQPAPRDSRTLLIFYEPPPRRFPRPLAASRKPNDTAAPSLFPTTPPTAHILGAFYHQVGRYNNALRLIGRYRHHLAAETLDVNRQ